MTLSMACSFAAYEFFRTASTTLFTETFPQRRPLALATAAVSPFSIVLLGLYSKALDRSPRHALRMTLLAAMATSGIVLLASSVSSTTVVLPVVTMLTFLFQNSYLNLLCSQQWSFVNSVMDDDTTDDDSASTRTPPAVILGRIAGTSCAVSTLAAAAVPWLVRRGGGVQSLWVGAMVLHTLAWLLGEGWAYRIAIAHGWDPQPNTATQKEGRSWKDALSLFRRVPILPILAVETMAFSALSTVVNVRTMSAVADAIPDAVQRSALWGNFYAWTNGAAAIVQFGIVPLFLSRNMQLAWRWVAVVPLCAVVAECWQHFTSIAATTIPTYYYLAAALWATKVMDYSVRSVAGNMVYQPLDFESRFFGKGAFVAGIGWPSVSLSHLTVRATEIISVLGSRLGRSGSSLLLLLAPGSTVGVLTAAVWAWSTQALAKATGDKSNDATKKVK